MALHRLATWLPRPCNDAFRFDRMDVMWQATQFKAEEMQRRSPQGTDALRVVADVSRSNEISALREKLREAEAALKAIQKSAGEVENGKHFNLMWLGRRDWRDILLRPDHPSYASVVKITSAYPKEIEDLDDGWHHGFHTGIVAASRLYLGLSAHKEDDLAHIYYVEEDFGESRTLAEKLEENRQSVLEDFPELDS